MVELEEVEDAELDRPQPGPINEDDEDSADFTDTGFPPFPFPHLYAILAQTLIPLSDSYLILLT
jgi:hypothetical protein